MPDELALGVVRRYFGDRPAPPPVMITPEERAGQYLRMNEKGWANMVKAKGFNEALRWRREREAEAKRLGLV